MWMGYLVYLLTLLAALSCGLVGGALMAFSDFIMPALQRVAPEAAVPSMRGINAAARQSWFLKVLGLAAALSVALVVIALMRWHMPDSALLLLGAALYLLGRWCATPRATTSWRATRRSGRTTSRTGRAGTTCAPPRRSPPRRSSRWRCNSASTGRRARPARP